MIHSLQIGDVWFEDRPGGLSRVFSELLRHLPAAGVTAQGLIVGTDRAALSTEGRVRAFAPSSLPLLKRMLAARRAVGGLMRETRFNVVASHFALYTAPALGKFNGTPLVVHFHGPWAAEGDFESGKSLRLRAQQALESSVYNRASRFIVLSQAFARELASRYRVDEQRIRIVPAGIDLARFDSGRTRSELRQILNWPTDRPIVFALRRLVRRMGLENLIDAVPRIVQRIPDILVHIGGSGALKDELQARIRERGVENHVRLLGRIEDQSLPLSFGAADLSIVPTVALEGFGMITLESLAAGTPVLVSPIGGLPEVVKPLSEQLVLEGSSPEIIAGALGDIFLGRRPVPAADDCRRYVAEHFAWDKIASRTRDVYREAIA